MERAFTIGWRMGIFFALLYVCSALASIKEDANTVADAAPTVIESQELHGEALAVIMDDQYQIEMAIWDLWSKPFCFSETEDSVMFGCEYRDGAWYRVNNGDG